MTTFFLFLILFGVLYSYYAMAGACNPDYLNNRTLAYFIGNETGVTYDNAQGNSNLDLTTHGGSNPAQTSEVWGYGLDFEASTPVYVYGTTTADIELTNFTIGYHFIPEQAPDHAEVFSNLLLSGTYRGCIFQYRDNDVFSLLCYYGGSNQYFYSQSTDTLGQGDHGYIIGIVEAGQSNEIYINNSEVAYGAQTSGTVDYHAGSHALTFGRERYNGGSQYLDGVIGEMIILNGTLNSSCRAYIQANNYPFFADTTAPTITLIYPANNTHYNNYNDSIIINATDDVAVTNCTLNNTNWVYTNNAGDQWRFDYAGAPNANYSLLANCTDAAANVRTTPFNFAVDTVDPTINIFSPANNTAYNSNVLFNLSYYDLYLYNVKTSISDPTGYPDELSLKTGTWQAGNITSLYAQDGNIYNLTEAGGTPGADLLINFSEVGNFSAINLYYHYDGNPAHNLYLQAYNYTAGGFTNLIEMDSGFTGWENMSFGAGNYSDFISAGLVQMKINHSSAGNIGHHIEIDAIEIAGNHYYYLNESNSIFSQWYNITEYWDISNTPDGDYIIWFEATDTHTAHDWGEELDVNTGPGFTTYNLNKGPVTFRHPNEIQINTIVEADRWRQDFDSIIDTDAGEIEIEIEAQNIEYFPDSSYNCHLIINGAYWFDCEGLTDASEIEIEDNKAKFKFNHIEGASISDSIGGLNYVNQSFNITIDTTAPTLKDHNTTNTTTSILWDVGFNEVANYSFIVGLNCTDNSISTGSGYAASYSETNIGLSSGTVHYMNLSVFDAAGNTNIYCINGTTANATTGAINYTLIREIINEEIEAETMNISVIFGLFAVVATFAYLGRKSEDDVIRGLFSMFAIYALLPAINAIRVVAIDNSASNNIINPIIGVLIAVLLVALFMSFYMIYKLAVAIMAKIGKPIK